MESVLRDVPAIAMLAEDDVEQARMFWRDTVGLEEVYHDAQYGEAAFRCGGTVFAIYQHKGGSGADHTQIAFQVEDVREAVSDLKARGIRFEEYDVPGIKTQDGIAEMGEGQGLGAWFLDPGGNIVGVVTQSKTLVTAVEGIIGAVTSGIAY